MPRDREEIDANVIKQNGRIQGAILVSLKPRLLAVFAALSFSPFATVAEQTATPVNSGPEDAAPRVVFSIPRYTPTALELETVAACLVLEAASQGGEGMRGVMAVIRNRARGLPELFALVVLQRRQFSAFNRLTVGHELLAQAIQRARRDRMWERALALVEEARSEAWQDSTAGATHYTRSIERTRWTRRLVKTVTIGAHSFYR
jgi:spore germination cell wall hydrolase CwlJ-like protein